MNVAELRVEIDRIDEEIVNLIARRFAVCREVGALKGRTGLPVMQPARVLQVRQRCARLGAERGLNSEFVDRLYQLIIAEVCRVEDELVAAAAIEAPPVPMNGQAHATEC